MTDIIRLNESIDDYAARPVITRLGEPDLAIRPSTYLDALGASTNIDPKQILIDGSFGQTVNPAPFAEVGTGAMTIKSDADGVYLAMTQKGLRTNPVMNTRNDRGTLVIIKYRLNDIFTDDSRVMAIGTNTVSTSGMRLGAFLDPKRVDSNSGYSAPLDNLVHTIAVYNTPDKFILFEGTEKYTAPRTSQAPNTLIGLRINTATNANLQHNDLDLYGFELYLDVSLTEQQVINYLKTL